MKKIVTFFSSLALLFTVSFASAQGLNAGFGLGVSYPSDPEKVAFDSSVFADFDINPFFSLGFETGFGWINNKVGSGERTSLGSLNLGQSITENFYTIPLLAVATINIPLGEESPLMPFISGGAGYSWTVYDYSSDSSTFHGFTWQVMAGGSYNLGETASNMKVFLEVGYRGTMIENEDDYELDMSGFIGHVGVSFPLSGGEY